MGFLRMREDLWGFPAIYKDFFSLHSQMCKFLKQFYCVDIKYCMIHKNQHGLKGFTKNLRDSQGYMRTFWRIRRDSQGFLRTDFHWIHKFSNVIVFGKDSRGYERILQDLRGITRIGGIHTFKRIDFYWIHKCVSFLSNFVSFSMKSFRIMRILKYYWM